MSKSVLIIKVIVCIIIVEMHTYVTAIDKQPICGTNNAACGGRTIPPLPPCCPQYQCLPLENLAVDIPGNCLVCGKYNAVCGGRTFPPNPPCCPPYECHPIENLMVDIPGNCLVCVPEGQPCHVFRDPNTTYCCGGNSCAKDLSIDPIIADAPGICKNCQLKGMQCGEGIRKCCDGLVCKNNPDIGIKTCECIY